MIRQLSIPLAGFLAFVSLFTGCKQPGPAGDKQPGVAGGSKSSAVQLQPQFQNESQFIVHSIVSDLAEQIYFAKFHRSPGKEHFTVVVKEAGGSIDEPLYELEIRLDPKLDDQKLELKVGGPIWSADVYRPVVQELARTVKLRTDGSSKAEDTSLLSKLLDATPETIELQNRELSKALEKDFSNPALHEKAALLLGAFAFREHSGKFFDIRSPLSRITVHLAMAQFFRGTNSFGINGQMAETMMLTLVNDQVAALGRLSSVNTNTAAAAAMVRGLRARITGDYRPLAAEANRSPFESIEWFYATADRIDVDLAWPKLSDEQRESIDMVRIADELNPTVGVENETSGNSIQLEMREIKSIYELMHPGQAMPSDIGKVLNVLPEYCFEAGAGKKSHVDILGWGQWATFFQRHLCEAIQQNFYYLNSMLGAPEEAKEFAASCDQSFGHLTLYPFVRRFDSTENDEYHKSVDDGFKLIASMPQFVPAGCWNSLYAPVSFGPLYNPNPKPGIDEWHNHNPLPGTVYDLPARLGQASLTNRADVVARLEALHALAPYDRPLVRFMVRTKYNNGDVPYDQAMAWYGEMLPYSPVAMRAVAYDSLYARPEKYEQLMSQAAEMDPWYYYDLGNYEFQMNNFTREDKAAEYYQKGFDMDPDRVGASHHAEWLVKYWLKHNRTAKAGAVAEEAGAVYSAAGLNALALFREATSNYDGAFETLSNMEERYNNSTALLNFCFRYKTKTGDSRFEAEVQKRIGKLFPKGFEQVSLEDFKSPPTDGVAFLGDNYAMVTNHMKMTDVIVAVYGVRVHNVAQYTYARTLKDTPELDLILWQGDAYHELRLNVPGHLFGVDIGDYSPYVAGLR